MLKGNLRSSLAERSTVILNGREKDQKGRSGKCSFEMQTQPPPTHWGLSLSLGLPPLWNGGDRSHLRL